jgi:catechol 2,3-dioxygenase-like lactoylglutathione lyase family enzyme
MFRGIQEIVASVSDVARIARVFTRIANYREIRLPDASAEQRRAWHAPRSVRRIEQRLLVPPGPDKGAVRLVKFHGGRQRLMRSSAHTWDPGGIFDIDVYTRDARKVYRELQAEGWSAYGEPTDYSWGGFDVCEVVATGPDGLVIALIEPKKIPPGFAGMRGFTRVFNSAQIVADYDATLRFYTQQLGWKVFVDTIVRDVEEPGAEVLGIPRPLATQVVRRIGIVHPEGTNDGSLEPIALEGLGGRHVGEHCVAPNLGWLSYRMPVAEAEAYAAELRAGGIALYGEPTTYRLAPYGLITAFAVRTPDGAIIEFYSSVATR